MVRLVRESGRPGKKTGILTSIRKVTGVLTRTQSLSQGLSSIKVRHGDSEDECRPTREMVGRRHGGCGGISFEVGEAK